MAFRYIASLCVSCHVLCLGISIRTYQSSNLSHSSFADYDSIYSELGKIISYRIMPSCSHDTLLKALRQLVHDVDKNKNRTLDEEIFRILDAAQKPMTAQAITYEKKSCFLALPRSLM